MADAESSLPRTTRRFGQVALLGRPNVGKSTLLNALVGTHLSIVTAKPQTTRHRILGVAHHGDAQLAFLDTPGLHDAGRRALNRRLNRVARQVPDEADVLVHVIEALHWTDEDEYVWRLVAAHPQPRILVINKVDRVKDKSRLLPFAAGIARAHDYASMHYLAASRGDGTGPLLDELAAAAPVAAAAYDEDSLTDRSERFLAAEMVREQLMRRLSAELPYSIAVEIERFEDDAGLARIGAVIWVERDSQKAIVIGSGGRQLKSVGTDARHAMQALFGRRVHLELWVRVREGWSDDERALTAFGYGG
jgi:GTP-binding protein Era